MRTPLLVVCAVASIVVGPADAASGTAERDAFLEGYVSALLETQLDLPDARVSVRNGAVRVEAEGLSPLEEERLREVVGALDGVRVVEVVEPTATEALGAPIGLFPERNLFEPLLADPRWPRFSLFYQRYLSDNELSNVGAVSFGEMFPLVGGRAPDALGGRWGLGVLGAVFSIFDLDAPSTDLVNSDFLGGLSLSWRRAWFATLLRLQHQSSHLGDEFLLRNRVERVNLSFEVLDVLLSADLPYGLRVYGGGGYLVRREPSDLDPFVVEAGVEWRSPRTFLGGHLRPLVGTDIGLRQESDWEPDVAVIWGLQLESGRLEWLALQLLGEYYHGRSPNGQFFERPIEYLGVGARLRF